MGRIKMFNLFNRDKSISILAPMTGDIIEITQVEDEVFSEKMVGDGVAIEPREGIVVSPVQGRIVQIFPTKHALGIETEDGLEILIHIGLDTVELKGEGFKSYVKVGDEVKLGDKLLEVDLDFIRKSGRSTVSPIIITNMDIVKNISTKIGNVNRGEDSIMNVVI
nr:PTS glucose transporter subunit IIA [Clostridium sp. Cult3]